MAALTWVDGEWREGNVPLIGSLSHSSWMASVAFDGARAFEGVTPDLDRHCARVVRSAQALGLAPMLSGGEIEEIARDGVARFPAGTALYIRPLFFCEQGMPMILPDPETTRFAMVFVESPMPQGSGFTACLSPWRRPSPDTAPTEAKAACLYPQSARALRDAVDRGFNNCVMLDPLGTVAEFATANVWLVKDGVAITPSPNGTFLNGITRQRVAGLLRADGIAVEERPVRPDELRRADEIFNTGNFGKVQPVIRYEDRDLQPGPVYRRARELYWDFAHSRR